MHLEKPADPSLSCPLWNYIYMSRLSNVPEYTLRKVSFPTKGSVITLKANAEKWSWASGLGYPLGCQDLYR